MGLVLSRVVGEARRLLEWASQVAIIIKLVSVESTVRAIDSSSIEAFLSTLRPATRNPNNNGDSVEPGSLPSAVGANVTNGNNPETGDCASGFVTAVILAATGFCRPGAASVSGATSTGGLVDGLI